MRAPYPSDCHTLVLVMFGPGFTAAKIGKPARDDGNVLSLACHILGQLRQQPRRRGDIRIVETVDKDDAVRRLSLDRHVDLRITKCPIAKASICVRSRQSMASRGVQTMGSCSLNEVFSRTGTPVRCSKARSSLA